MALSDHVVSLELAKKWKDSGGGQDTEFEWSYISGKWSILPSIECEHGESCIAAPLASEMMEWFRGRESEYWIQIDTCIERVDLFDKYGYLKKSISYESLPNALMQMLLERREEK
jgi:hypothetical protein